MVSTIATIIQHSSRSTFHSNPRRKRNKRIQIGKEVVKLLLLTDNMILYIGNPKDIIRKLLQSVNLVKSEDIKSINTQKLFAFLYINNEKSEREIKESIPFTAATKRIKYLGINLPKGDKIAVYRKM